MTTLDHLTALRDTKRALIKLELEQYLTTGNPESLHGVRDAATDLEVLEARIAERKEPAVVYGGAELPEAMRNRRLCDHKWAPLPRIDSFSPTLFKCSLCGATENEAQIRARSERACWGAEGSCG